MPLPYDVNFSLHAAMRKGGKVPPFRGYDNFYGVLPL